MLVYYNNSLYFNTEKQYTDKDGNPFTAYEIYKLSLDGTNRELIYSSTDIYILSFKIHRGYIYFEGYKLNSEGEATSNNSALYKISVDGKGETTELFSYYKYKNINVIDTRFYGNHIFLVIDYNDEGNNGTLFKKYLINYNIQTDKWENLSKKLQVNIENMFTIFNDKLIFANGSKIYECDFKGNNQKEVFDCKKVLDGYQYYNALTNDGENLIISAGNDDENSDKLIFCNKYYEASAYKMPFPYLAEIGCDSNVFIKYNEEDLKLYLIDKLKLGNNTSAE